MSLGGSRRTRLAIAAALVAGLAIAAAYRVAADRARGSSRFAIDTAEFFDLLNLEYPGLQQVKAAVHDGRYDEAVHAYVTWRETGDSRPRFFFEPNERARRAVRDADPAERAALLRDAGALLANRLPLDGHVFAIADPPDFFPERANRLVTHAGRLFGVELSRHKPLEDATVNSFEVTARTLSLAYLDSGDERYAAKFCDWVNGWIDHASPLPDPYLAGDVTHPQAYFLVTASRRMTSWLDATHALRGSACLDANGQFAVLREAAAHVLYVDASLTDALGSAGGDANHAFWFRPYSAPLVTASQQAHALLLLPELKARDRMLERAFELLTQYGDRFVTAEGHEPQRDPGYHVSGFRGLMDVALLADLNGVQLPASISRTLERAVDLVLRIIEPTGHLPAVGHTPTAATAASFFAVGASLFQRADFAWFAASTPDIPTRLALLERGERGIPEARKPELRSEALADTGFYVMRSGDGLGDSLYLLFDLAPAFGHVHRDALNIIATGFGSRPPYNLLDDSGIGGNWPINLQTPYYASERAHNVLLVDGAPPPSWTDEPRPVARTWVSLPSLDVATGTYGRRYAGTEIVRTVIFVKGEYWLVRDRVEGPGAHRLERLFNFAPVPDGGTTAQAIRIDAATAAAEPQYPGPRLLIVPGSGRPAARVENGWKNHSQLAGTDPFGDAVSPTLVYETRASTEDPVILESVLFPLRKGETRSVRTSAIKVRDVARGAYALRVEIGPDQTAGESAGRNATTDDFYANETNGIVTYESGTELLGRQGLVRTTADGAPMSVCMIEARELSTQGHRLTAGTATNACVRRLDAGGRRWGIESDGPLTYQIPLSTQAARIGAAGRFEIEFAAEPKVSAVNP